MHDNRVARRYASAFFSTALKYDVVAAAEDDLQAISGLLSGDASFRHFLLTPFSGREEKLHILEKLFSDRVTALTMQALRIIVDKGRESEIPAIHQEFQRLRREHENIMYVTVTSAEAMEEDQRRRLVAKLQTVLGKTVEPDFKIDPHLIGGVRVAYENYVLDGSIRGTLTKLRERLRYDLLKQI